MTGKQAKAYNSHSSTVLHETSTNRTLQNETGLILGSLSWLPVRTLKSYFKSIAYEIAHSEGLTDKRPLGF